MRSQRPVPSSTMPTPGPVTPSRRCAVYTRKSTDEGLDQEYNSLEAQRDAGLAFIASQRHEGWIAVEEGYDDGGYSGGNLDRPALKRLLADIEEAETGDQGRMRHWLSQAVRAPQDPAWVADGVVVDEWAPVSPVTGKLDAFEWRAPMERIGHVIEAEDALQAAPALPAAPEPPAKAEPAATSNEPPSAPAVGPVPEEKEPDQPVKPVILDHVAPGDEDESPFRPIIPDDPGPDPEDGAPARPAKGLGLF